ncbi:Williams-Beuren syndrome chromosomal region 27 protein [Plakobranchus ocellatus]|uniref:Williams-Beuren syndrome chromosomal region 27 protein n=1 Tax=Plakobranchus ocellatus TaxID=259542 RepID=A0AAV4BC25_9GAST|nr:Williams-Beuren syndrome chromosomal region 27 protein [Plakobranchus ocellatus]
MSHHSFKDASEFIQSFHKPGLSSTECVSGYNEESAIKVYNDYSIVLSYNGPVYIANMLAGLIPDKDKTKVLDLAAGTGLVGEALYKRGFRNLDALDGGEALVNFCKSTGVFQDLFTCIIGDGHKLPMKDNTYDAIACSGGTIENHLPPSSQIEIARIIKPGGFFVNAYRANLHETEEEYANEWREVAERLENEGTWTLYGRFFFKKFHKLSQGQMDVYQKFPQQGDLRLSGPPSGQSASAGVRTRDRRVPSDLRADSLAAEPPTPPTPFFFFSGSFIAKEAFEQSISAILRYP